MSSKAVVVQSVSKCYALDAKPTERIRQLIAPNSFRPKRELWALRDISFSVSPGETVGIMGRNGCGKSTLLEIIAGTIAASSGEIRANGQVAALLELGAGFDPEMTGRENVFIYGALLGMSRHDIDMQFDEIMQFAELEAFIDEPVKLYSTGMFMRLAFSVAVSAVPDVLLIDEALAVGDEAFQRRCFGRLEQLKEQGVSLILVSHAASTVLEICDRALLLDAGETLILGRPRDVVERYHRLIFAAPEKQAAIREEIRTAASSDSTHSEAETNEDHPMPAAYVDTIESERFDPGLTSKSAIEYSSHGAHVSDVIIRNLNRDPVNVLLRGAEYSYEFRVDFDADSYRVRYGMLIKSIVGVELGGIATHAVGDGIDLIESGSSIQVRIPFKAMLVPGTYFGNAGVVGVIDGAEIFLHRITDVIVFRVASESGSKVTGAIDLSVDTTCEVSPVERPR
jgi:lipopolysaccharide transport system ATP-binding protein